MLSCRQIANMGGLLPAGLPGILIGLQVRMHLLICRQCRRYARQSRLLRKALEKFCDTVPDDETDVIVNQLYDRLDNTDESTHGK